MTKTLNYAPLYTTLLHHYDQPNERQCELEKERHNVRVGGVMLRVCCCLRLCTRLLWCIQWL